MRDKWLECENGVLKAAVRELGVSNWDEISCLIPRRSPSGCKKRWNRIHKIPVMTTLLMDDVVYEPFIERKGHWNRLPDLPFLMICQHLEPKQIFASLPRVCRHFKNLVASNSFVIPYMNLGSNVKCTTLYMLTQRVSHCQHISFKANQDATHQVWWSLMSEFLNKSAHSLKSLNCVTANGKPITDLINKSQELVVLNIRISNVRKGWDWNELNPCLTVKALTFDDPCNPQENLLPSLTKFPSITHLEQMYKWPAPKRGTTDKEDFDQQSKPEHTASLTHFKTATLLPVMYMKEIRYLVYTSCISTKVTQRLVRILPHLDNLENLEIMMSDGMLDYLFCQAGYFVNWLDCQMTLESLPKLKRLKISKMTDRDDGIREKFDQTIKNVLLTLPAYISTIIYRNRAIRTPSPPMLVIPAR